MPIHLLSKIVTMANATNPMKPDKDWMGNFYKYLHYRTQGIRNFDQDSSYANEAKLASWIRIQQNKKIEVDSGEETDLLIQQQIAILKSVRFPFTMTRAERQSANFIALKQFYEENGHFKVNQRSDDGLGRYVSRIREEYKLESEQRTFLRDDMIDELNGMGFPWVVKQSNTDSWEAKFELLKRYKEKNKHCDVKRRENDEEYKGLGKWVSEQRAKKKKGTLDTDCIRSY
jgi:hypothetical protein